MFIEKFRVESPNVTSGEHQIESVYSYETTELVHEVSDGIYQWVVRPKFVQYRFKTNTRVLKLGVMLVGWGREQRLHPHRRRQRQPRGDLVGDQGEDPTGQLLWLPHPGLRHQSWILQWGRNLCPLKEEIYAPFKSLLPMICRTVNPDDIIFGGWDINSKSSSAPTWNPWCHY